MAAPVQPTRPFLVRQGHWVLLLLLLTVGLGLRLYGQNWENGHLFHPDERHILMTTERLALPWPPDVDLLLSKESPLNPKSFAYGSFPFYLLRGLTAFLVALGGTLPFLEPLRELRYLANMAQIGRTLSALFDIGTIALVYLLGTRLYRRSVGLLAAAFVALSVIHIQLSHFYAVDTPMTFFVMATLFGSVLLMQRDPVRIHARVALFTGAMIGLALASKVSASPVIGAVAAAYLLWLISDEDGRLRWSTATAERFFRAVKAGLLMLGATTLTFVVLQPYALVDFSTFVQHIVEQNAMARGHADFPYTRQYVGRPDYVYFLQQLTLFGLGLPLGLAALAGWLWVVVRAARDRHRADLFLLAWVVPYFLIVGSFHAKFLRYLLPITPVLCLFAASALLDLRTRLGGLRPVATALIALVVASTALYALAFASMYSTPHPAVTASEWIYRHVPSDSAIATEHWEEGMPVPLVIDGEAYTVSGMRYRGLELRMYEADNQQKLQHLVEQLQRADYIVFFSNRLYGTIPRLPERYAMSAEYYRLLFGEQLGFELVHASAKYPSLLGIVFVDDTFSDPRLPTPRLLREAPAGVPAGAIVFDLGRADESFSVYDHPKPLVFKKTRQLSETELRTLLEPHLASVRTGGDSRGAPGSDGAPGYKTLMLDEAQQAAVRAGGTFRELFSRDSIAGRAPVLVWVLLVEALGLAAMPIAFLVFRRLADRGYLLAKTLGVLLLTWFSWMAVSLGLVQATRESALAALALVILLGVGVGFWRRAEIVEFWGPRLRLLLLGEGVFWAAFAFFLFVRMSNPDLWHPARGGEKPMDLAYLMAAIKSATYPPYDPWFAGGYLNYYYYGQIIVATLVKVSGIVPTTAYNLVVPLLFALTFGSAFTVGYNLVQRSALRAPVVPNSGRVLAGLAAALFMGVMGNRGGFDQIVTQLARIGAPVYQSGIPVVGVHLEAFVGLVRVIVEPGLLQIPTDWYWASTRVIKDTINEFPYFTFLYADLHAHMIALPVTVFVLALAVELVRSGFRATSHEPSWAGQRLGFTAPTFLADKATNDSESKVSRAAAAAVADAALGIFVAGLAVGALMPTNSWDFPTYLGLVALAMLIPWYLSERPTRAGLALVATRIGVIAALSYALYLPFHQNFQSFYSGVVPSPDTSAVRAYLAIHGFFLAVMASFILLDVGSYYRRSGLVRTLRLALLRWADLPRLLSLRARLVRRSDDRAEAVVYGALGMVSVALLLSVLDMALVGLLLAALVVVALLALRRGQPPEQALLYALFGTGLALGIVTELVAIDGDVGRMNTVFKFYLQVWTMWSIASAVALTLILARLRSLPFAWLRRLWVWALAALLLAGFVYPVVATPARVADRFTTDLPLTLDGTAYMRHAAYVDNDRELRIAADLAAIQWLQDHVDGTPIILEAHTPLYRWGSRVSIYTGLPTVIGWDWHQTQQRLGYRHLVEQRRHDVETAYTTRSPEQAMSILRRYDVEYIYVGGVEYAYYPVEGLEKYDTMVGQYLDLVYDHDGVKIYRVK